LKLANLNTGSEGHAKSEENMKLAALSLNLNPIRLKEQEQIEQRGIGVKSKGQRGIQCNNW
jgi:hypothetical protein